MGMQFKQAMQQQADALGQALITQTAASSTELLVSNDILSLNVLLGKHRAGMASEQDFTEFMAKHGEFFPENPRNTEELIDSLAQRAAAAQQFYNSLTPEQRAERHRANR